MRKMATSQLETLGVDLALRPMEARTAAELPAGPGWHYEPKWDGFRCLAFRAGGEVEIKAKSGKSLARFFPELLDNLRALRPGAFVLDGELTIAHDGALSFDALQARLHPAESRIRRLSLETPATFVAFDCLLATRGKPLLHAPFVERRAALEALFANDNGRARGLALTPFTRALEPARRWLRGQDRSLDGVVAKRLDLPYLPGVRATLKVKSLRTADCVVGGFRYDTRRRLVGSLLLGLYDEKGLLHHVGFTASIAAADKPGLTKRLEKLIARPGFSGAQPGAPSRWSSERSSAWEPLRPSLVAEVRYDHVSGDRFRHGTKFMRWRPDKSPRQCTLEQLWQAMPRGSAHLARHVVSPT
jgi:ATP-dependent DNA ligase